jgi:hypothetical protein
MYWDGEEEPSVLVPLGGFLRRGPRPHRNFVSAPLQMSPEDGKSFNSFFHMPFADGARIEVTSELEHEEILFYYYVTTRSSTRWRKASAASTPSGAGKTPRTESRRGQSNEEFLFGGENASGAGNYTILEAEGRGHYVGCVLNVRNLRETGQWNWYGEGDDMIL